MELKVTIPEIKILWKRLPTEFTRQKSESANLECRIIEIIQSEAYKEKGVKGSVRNK